MAEEGRRSEAPDDLGTLATHALGAADPGDEPPSSLLARRPELREEWAELTATAAALSSVPRDRFAVPPQGGTSAADRLLAGALDRIAADEARGADELAARRARKRIPPLWLVVAAVVAAVATAGVGFATGRSTAGQPSAGPTVTTTVTPGGETIPGTLAASEIDTETGAILTAQVVPAAGWVQVHAAVGGIPEGRRCRLFVISESGERVLAGSWLVSARGAAEGTDLDGTALIDPADVASVAVESDQGVTLVTASV